VHQVLRGSLAISPHAAPVETFPEKPRPLERRDFAWTVRLWVRRGGPNGMMPSSSIRNRKESSRKHEVAPGPSSGLGGFERWSGTWRGLVAEGRCGNQARPSNKSGGFAKLTAILRGSSRGGIVRFHPMQRKLYNQSYGDQTSQRPNVECAIAITPRSFFVSCPDPG
jgi:hypothetical protein